MTKNLLCIVLLVAGASCEPQTDYDLYQEVASAAGDVSPFNGIGANVRFNQSMDQPAPITIQRRFIKEGSLEFEVTSIDQAKEGIVELTSKVGGYISEETQSNYTGISRYAQMVRIPADSLDKFVAAIEKLAERIENKSISVSDVTEEFIDIETRLRTKKALEVRYLDLLKQAKNVKDLIEVESQLASLRTEIESTEGRLRYLNNRVSFSTLTLNYYVKGGGGYGFSDRFVRSFGRGGNMFLEVLIGIFTLWPIAVASWFSFRWWRRRKKRL
jgi:hypothetical protein